MKDPRKGAFAIIAIGVYLALFLASATSILSYTGSGLELLGAIEAVYLWSLESMYLVAALSPPEPYEGLGKRFVLRSKGRKEVVLNVVVLALATVLCFWLAGYIALVPAPVSILVSVAMVKDCRRRLGFANGDVLGASNEIARVLSMSAVAVVMKWI